MAKFTGEVGVPARREKPQLELEEYLEKLQSRGLAADGRQLPDSTPMAPPVGFRRQPSMVEIVRDMVRSEGLRREAMEAGAESFEDADDFDVGEDQDLHSPYENEFDPPIAELVKEGSRVVAERTAEATQAAEAVPPAAGRGKRSGAPRGQPAPPEGASEDDPADV